MHQDHDVELPIVGSQMVVRVNLQTGERESQSPNGLKLEGSYSSSIIIRCDGNRVQAMGNPSRWQRADNLFGYTTFDDCVDVYNQILEANGLPPFTRCTQVRQRQTKEQSRTEIWTDGAQIDHVDLTRNFTVGKGAELPFIRGLASQQIGRGKDPYLYANGKTCDWYKGSTMLYKKVYEKAYDLIKHKDKRLQNASKEEIEHYEKVIQWCEDHGVLREEHSFKREWLRRKKLNIYGLTKELDFAEHTSAIENVISRLSVMKTQYETISDQLLANQIVKSRQAANATQSLAYQWLHGCALTKSSQFYVHRQRLLQIGIDIAIPYDVSKMPPQIRSNKVIDVRPANPPSWYRMPRKASRKRQSLTKKVA